MSEADGGEVELELTYLARHIPQEIRNVPPKHMLDIYVPDIARHPHLRLRQKNDKYEITDKQPIDNQDISRQLERTIVLDREQFEALATVSTKRVEKDRYSVVIEGNRAEVDVFGGALQGLVLIDFEFKTQKAKEKFIPPDCCLAEVTQEEFIAGGMLAGKSYADIEAKLSRFNYRKL